MSTKVARINLYTYNVQSISLSRETPLSDNHIIKICGMFKIMSHSFINSIYHKYILKTKTLSHKNATETKM